LDRARRGPVAEVTAQPRAEFVAEVRRQQFPFSVCTKHHAVIDPPTPAAEGCATCNPPLDHLVIRDESDLSLALAALE